MAECLVLDAETKSNIYSFVGQKVKERRKILKLSQSQLAELMGFSYQQMQKYESGTSQISVGRLMQFAKVLNVPLSYFFQGINLENTIGRAIVSDIIQSTRTKPINILLVEEHPMDIMSFKTAVASCGEKVSVDVLHNPDGVTDYLQHYHDKYGKERPDIIVLEVSFSKVSGISLLKTIKRVQGCSDIPAIVLTNSIKRKDLLDAYAAGAAGFIQKNADMQKYSKDISQLVDYWAHVALLPNM